MRSLIFLLLLVISTGLLAGEHTTTILTVKGMKDKSCTEKISNALTSLNGVENVSFNIEKGLVTIEHKNVDVNTLNSAIVEAGYKTNHKKSEKFHEVKSEGYNCSEAEKAGCNTPCGRKNK